MKYIKLFMLMAVAALFASCSDDDFNTNVAGTTVEFADAAYSANENGGVFQIPVKVTGKRNGDVSFRVTTAETGEVPAKEETNYMVTSKYITVKADSTTSTTTYVEIKAIDDLQKTGDRTFTVTIEGVEGATLGTNKTVTVTIKDNDLSYYTMFAGQWRLTGKFVITDEDGQESYEDFNFPLTISAVSTPGATGYEKTFGCLINDFKSPHFLFSGASLSFTMTYNYMESRKLGRLGIQCGGETVYSYDYVTNHFEWQFSNYTSGNPSRTAITARWTATEDNSIPSELEFAEGSRLAIVETGLGAGLSYGDIMTDLKITRSEY